MVPSPLLGQREGEGGTSLSKPRNCATADDEQTRHYFLERDNNDLGRSIS
jgi:hypothetical protein